MTARQFPLHGTERRMMRGRILTRAITDALSGPLSMKCSGRGMPWSNTLHAGSEDGCRNDGSTCLCDCHDSAGAA